ncbi:MAG TPA: PRC-barrel domain-containing protein [Solirubrobacteraceae bacterium]|nr:PRC-barrel domain-containing protein [Solirubrobacteraceae bacterium]
MELGEPASYLVLQAGTPVYSSDDQQIGKVTHVLASEDEDVFDGIVIGEHAFGHEHRFADADDIQEIFERGVVLKLDAEACAQLPKPSANPAVVYDDPSESQSEFRHQKLTRAWNLISGKY